EGSLDVVAAGLDRLAAHMRRVGTHIGDEAHGPLAGNLDTLVQRLGRPHGALSAEAEAGARRLLHGGGDERGRRARRRALGLDAGHAVGRGWIDLAGDGAQPAGRALALLVLADIG